MIHIPQSEGSPVTDIDIVEKFIFDELACRIHSADPQPTKAEEDCIDEARTARLAFRNLKDRLEQQGELKDSQRINDMLASRAWRQPLIKFRNRR